MKQKKAIPGVGKLDLRISWQAAYFAFRDRHGEPEEWAGRLWFRDGWSRSSTDYKGPIYEPPEDPHELRAIQIKYWTKRKTFALAEFKRVSDEIKQVTALVQQNPELLDEVELPSGKIVTPLQHVVRGIEHKIPEGMPGGGSIVMTRKKMNITEKDLTLILNDKLERIKMAIDECDSELAVQSPTEG